MAAACFGYSYLLDMYDCKPGVCDDLEVHYRFLERLVELLGMTPMSAPIVMHGPTVKGLELFPDKAGVSGWNALIESGIQIHSIEPQHFITLDVYSCKFFEPKVVEDFARETFDYLRFEEHYLRRGELYHS